MSVATQNSPDFDMKSLACDVRDQLIITGSNTEYRNEPDDRVAEMLKDMVLQHDVYVKVMELIGKTMDAGLKKETNPTSSIKMIPTYVRAIPDGSEQGNFLSLDLGGTNFRVLRIELKGREVLMTNKIYSISSSLMTGKGTDLFDYIASCLNSFVKEEGMDHKRLPLGFTFSFPCKQVGLTSAYLMKWTKGFECSGVEGEDVVKLLKEAVGRRMDGQQIDVVGVLNDTVGCCMSVAKYDKNCHVGVILGTGTNAAYMERLENVETWDGDLGEPKQVIINTEWGAFGDNGELDFLRTTIDRELDAASMHPGKQIYEKMISGMYLGEICREILAKLAKKDLIFHNKNLEMLDAPLSFLTKYVSEVEADAPGSSANCVSVLKQLGISDPTEYDCSVVRQVVHLVSTRAINLASAGIAAILNKMDRPEVTVAVDGSLYRFHPRFHDGMTAMIRKLVKPTQKFKLVLSEDGSGKGAAIVASVAVRLSNQK